MTDTGRLSGKRALVTGGSRGIGAAIATRLAADGADVVITYAAAADAAQSVVDAIRASGRKGEAIQADGADPVAQTAAFDAAAKVLGGIDIVVHNAGFGIFTPVSEDTPDNLRRQLALNVEGVHSGTIAALPHMPDGGRIIIIGSISGHTAPFPGSATYSATKAAVTGLALGWARDLAPRKILVNVVQPGPIATDMNPLDGPYAEMLVPTIPLGRYGEAKEVAALTAFLASDESSFITGSTIDIDGGMSI
ncbi:SDR family NAD(P)-dependent oxidoreductase [Sphingomonas endolithica]|uniref:SDR family NAD(P)-dependent oxidoreductase n=1 Tax=Sphingomonas endolithica TaxID=2972485 RepID=UPI0021B0500B|nr:SDR family oxidoreductase [Sphingomonas sp. ZFBP2030]